jgi:hypothetical protein
VHHRVRARSGSLFHVYEVTLYNTMRRSVENFLAKAAKYSPGPELGVMMSLNLKKREEERRTGFCTCIYLDV